MKKISVLLMVLSFQATAENRSQRIIYGVDNRVEPHQATTVQKTLSVSTAGMIANEKLVSHKDYYVLPPTAIENKMGLCSDEKFSDQPTSVVCSGFLIGPDLMVTAGHCIPNQEACDNVSFIFDYRVKESDQRADMMVKKDKVYKCQKVIESKLEGRGNRARDYALIRIDRKVTGRPLLSYRQDGKISDKQEIYVIGHPSGLPTKVAGDAKVFANESSSFFETNLDTFGGNSGSAVFNAENNQVEGILVRGAKDYKKDGRCIRVFEAPQDIAGNPKLGEAVSRITDISALEQHQKLIEMIKNNEKIGLADAVSEMPDLDMALENGNTLLHLAINAKNTSAALELMKAGAGINLQNSAGESPLHRAAFMNNKKVVEALIGAGVDVTLKDDFGVYASGRTNYFAFSLRSRLRKLERKALQ